MGEGLRRGVNVVWPLVLALGLIVLPGIPKGYAGPLEEAQGWWGGKLRVVSLSQRWGMYAPDPARSHSYARTVAVYNGDRRVPLEESERSSPGWGTVWVSSVSRHDFWSYRVTHPRPGKPNRNRTWFLRGLCVREDRRGQMPLAIRLERSHRKFTPPDKVRAGADVLGEEKHRLVETTSCVLGRTRTMVEDDRARRGDD